jgi:hypothetical protein
MNDGEGASPSAATPSNADRAIVGVAGCGLTGSRIVSKLVAAGHRVAVYDPDAIATQQAVRRAPRRSVALVDDPRHLAVCDLVVLCGPASHTGLASELVLTGIHVVSLSDDLDDVREMLELGDTAWERGATVVVGAGMAPGLSGLLARRLHEQLEVLDELHVAIHGTAGPACARQHHDALASASLGWHDREWITPQGGTGRDLVWFPEPIGAHDCYRAALADPVLLQRAFPTVGRISARVSATRRDRLTAWLPMLTPPHALGGLGAVRVEARGSGPGGERRTVIAGAAAPAAELAAAVAAATALQVLACSGPYGVYGTADAALDGLDLLHHATQFGVRVQEFTGVARATHW